MQIICVPVLGEFGLFTGMHTHIYTNGTDAACVLSGRFYLSGDHSVAQFSSKAFVNMVSLIYFSLNLLG